MSRARRPIEVEQHIRVILQRTPTGTSLHHGGADVTLDSPGYLDDIIPIVVYLRAWIILDGRTHRRPAEARNAERSQPEGIEGELTNHAAFTAGSYPASATMRTRRPHPAQSGRPRSGVHRRRNRGEV